MDKSGVQLVKELVETSYILPNYNTHLIEKVEQAVDKSKKELDLIIEEEDPKSPQISSALLYHHFAMRRNKRYLCVYHNERMNTLKRLRWQHGSTLPSEISENCSNNEQNFFKNYSQLLTGYMMNIELDLHGYFTPPTVNDLFIEVRVLTDIGDIYTNGERDIFSLLILHIRNLSFLLPPRVSDFDNAQTGQNKKKEIPVRSGTITYKVLSELNLFENLQDLSLNESVILIATAVYSLVNIKFKISSIVVNFGLIFVFVNIIYTYARAFQQNLADRTTNKKMAIFIFVCGFFLSLAFFQFGWFFNINLKKAFFVLFDTNNIENMGKETMLTTWIIFLISFHLLLALISTITLYSCFELSDIQRKLTSNSKTNIFLKICIYLKYWIPIVVIFLFSDTSRLWFLKNINKISNLKINDADELTSQSFDYDPDDVLFEEELKDNEYTNTNSWQYKFKNKIEVVLTDDICVPKTFSSLGKPCNNTKMEFCYPNLFCIKNKCALDNTGSKCEKDEECSGQVCLDKKCWGKKKIMEISVPRMSSAGLNYTSFYRICEHGALCDPFLGKCQLLFSLDVDDNCGDSSFCKEGLSCINNKCRSERPTTCNDNNQLCPVSDYCNCTTTEASGNDHSKPNDQNKDLKNVLNILRPNGKDLNQQDPLSLPTSGKCVQILNDQCSRDSQILVQCLQREKCYYTSSYIPQSCVYEKCFDEMTNVQCCFSKGYKDKTFYLSKDFICTTPTPTPTETSIFDRFNIDQTSLASFALGLFFPTLFILLIGVIYYFKRYRRRRNNRFLSNGTEQNTLVLDDQLANRHHQNIQDDDQFEDDDDDVVFL
ncbi:partner of sld5 [Anaeramoeba flamelloides]|uniref:Partner of sld5 n=1 Tax=Anaeramoeba flamelloides TaxID=1746091 RepID=A0AAV8A3M9_9EUKA|nr:partner of sld5 [Anaeramoeba flamelloides]